MTRSALLKWIKYPIAVGLLLLVLQQADLSRIGDILFSIQPLWLLVAFLLFTSAQLVSVARLNAYYRWHSQPLSYPFSLRMHYVALLYNIVIPGGIGGDGYRIYLLKKRADYSAKTGIKIQLVSRLNGLLVIGLSILLLLCFIPLPKDAELTSQLVLQAIVIIGLLAFIGYVVIIPKLFAVQREHELIALCYSVAIHLLNLACVSSLFVGLGGDISSLPIYLLLFQIALIAGMIPITVGGLGLREFVFFYGAASWNQFYTDPIDSELGVALSLLVFALTLISACIGFAFMSRIEEMKPCVDA